MTQKNTIPVNDSNHGTRTCHRLKSLDNNRQNFSMKAKNQPYPYKFEDIRERYGSSKFLGAQLLAELL